MVSLWKQKDVGENFRYLSHVQALALPSLKISNQASPRQRVLYIRYAHKTKDGSYTYGYNTPCMDASLRISSESIKFARFVRKKITSRKRPSSHMARGVARARLCDSLGLYPTMSWPAQPMRTGFVTPQRYKEVRTKQKKNVIFF